MKRLSLLLLCFSMLLSTSTVFASDIDSKDSFIEDRTERVEETTEKIIYAYEQDDYDDVEYKKSNIKRNFVMNGDSATDIDVIKQVIEESNTVLTERDLKVKFETGALTNDTGYRTCKVPVFEQINGYYCGPATLKQVIHFINGSSLSQSQYATKLGTTTAGTDMTVIRTVLNEEISGLSYKYYTFSSFDSWFIRVRASIDYNFPAILDIDTRHVSAFPYNSSGHYVNVSGYDVYRDMQGPEYDTHLVRITDPWGPGLGNRWYESNDLYTANSNHWRSAIIW